MGLLFIVGVMWVTISNSMSSIEDRRKDGETRGRIQMGDSSSDSAVSVARASVLMKKNQITQQHLDSAAMNETIESQEVAVTTLIHLNATFEPLTEKQRALKKVVEARLKQYHDRENARVAKEQKPLLLAQRKEYASVVETNMLDRGMEATVTTQGREAKTLRIKFILIGKVFVNNLEKDDQFFSMLRRLGFTKLITTDGYNGSWSWDLTP